MNRNEQPVLETFKPDKEVEKKSEASLHNLDLEECARYREKIAKKDERVGKYLNHLKEYDESTYKHSLEVGNIVSFFMKKFKDQFNKKERESLVIAALLHDFGKMGVNSNILNKKEDLETWEKEVIKTHPIITHEILKDWRDLVAKITACHHQYQKHPYPEKDFTEEILKGMSEEDAAMVRKLSKVLAIADSFEAMTDPARPSNKNGMKNIDEITKELDNFFMADMDRELIADIIFSLHEYYQKRQEEQEKNNKTVWN